jgi:Domain of unknown function (DUF4411)
MNEVYVLDTNVFIQAKRTFYPFEVCPGYWKAMSWHRKSGRVMSIDRVRDEIERGGDDLWSWVQTAYGQDGFASVDEPSVTRWFGEMAAWVQAQPHFLPQARTEFASEEVADGWLAAYAKSRSSTVVVTLEEFNAESRRKVQLPNICKAFEVEWITPFQMLRRLGVELDWKEPSTERLGTHP